MRADALAGSRHQGEPAGGVEDTVAHLGVSSDRNGWLVAIVWGSDQPSEPRNISVDARRGLPVSVGGERLALIALFGTITGVADVPKLSNQPPVAAIMVVKRTTCGPECALITLSGDRLFTWVVLCSTYGTT